jgi:cytochrome P450
VKCNFRVARVPVKVGDVDVAPGTTVMLLLGAINRDPRHFERPAELLADRANAREHLSFSRGIHSCAGAPLARAEGFICLQRIFDHIEDFSICDSKHGPAGERRYSYEPTYLLRGIQALHLDIQPRTGAVPAPRAA